MLNPVLQLLPGDMPQFRLERGLVLVASEFPGEFFGSLGLGLCVGGQGLAGKHGYETVRLGERLKREDRMSKREPEPAGPPPYQSAMERFPDHVKAFGMMSIEMANLDRAIAYDFWQIEPKDDQGTRHSSRPA